MTAAAAVAGTGGALAQGYPDKPITLYCPWTAGGNSDIALRVLADVASRSLPRRMVVENKPGVGGAMGAMHMAQTAKPDGYTISQTPLGVFRVPFMAKTTFDPLVDLS